MRPDKKTAEMLNDLIEINNDRVLGYEKAKTEANPSESSLKSLFSDMAATSRGFANDISQYVRQTGQEPSQGSTARGKLYRSWMDVKATFSGNDRKAILASCEFGEDAIQRAYKSALSSDTEIPADARQMISDQQSRLRRDHDRIKALRDA